MAVDSLDGSLKSFQELSNRARRDVRIDDVIVSVCVFAFDIMYLDGQVRDTRTGGLGCKPVTDRIIQILLQTPFCERRQLLRSRFPPLNPQQQNMARFNHVQSCESEEGREAIEDFWELALNSRTEGLMVKVHCCSRSATFDPNTVLSSAPG